MSIKSISSAFHVSRNTVRKYVRRYQESGLTLDQLMTMSEEKLQELFLDNQNRSRRPSPRMDELEALIPDYVKRLSRKGVTVKSLHDEYLRELLTATSTQPSSVPSVGRSTMCGSSAMWITLPEIRCT